MKINLRFRHYYSGTEVFRTGGGYNYESQVPCRYYSDKKCTLPKLPFTGGKNLLPEIHNNHKPGQKAHVVTLKKDKFDKETSNLVGLSQIERKTNFKESGTEINRNLNTETRNYVGSEYYTYRHGDNMDHFNKRF